jgi:hypothetical protein
MMKSFVQFAEIRRQQYGLAGRLASLPDPSGRALYFIAAAHNSLQHSAHAKDLARSNCGGTIAAPDRV